VAGESLNRPDESKLSSVRFLLSPFGRAAHALRRLKSACHGGADRVRESGATGSNSWEEHPSAIKSTDKKAFFLLKRILWLNPLSNVFK